jgi:hypothetical protein
MPKIGRHEECTPHRRSSDVDDTGHVAPRVLSAEELALMREAFETGKAFGFFDNGEPPAPERVVWAEKPIPGWKKPPPRLAPSPETVLLAAIQSVKQRPRERKGRTASSTAGSRGDPSEPSDESDLGPRPPLTPAQRAWLKREVDRRRREVVDGGLVTTEADYRLFAEDRA